MNLVFLQLENRCSDWLELQIYTYYPVKLEILNNRCALQIKKRQTLIKKHIIQEHFAFIQIFLQ